MGYEIGLVHTCSIITRSQTSQDGFGAPVYTGSTETSACRFYSSSGRIISTGSGEHDVAEPKLMLPPTANVEKGNTITSEISGFSGPYRVEHVMPVFELFSGELHHYECDLKAVD